MALRNIYDYWAILCKHAAIQMTLCIEVVSPPRMDNFIGYTIKHTFFESDG
jgi:hypothetical protein